ncbi:hypothetical protein Bca4012_024750 [Brassica carinata]|uniref:Uncharacterized protein n=1 Tax=Brassica carinata TaxID=52824 RepID=A0A8X8ASG7_BRACI|nr:hypothetical protein Bca52824_021810 [Brassica carinata]
MQAYLFFLFSLSRYVMKRRYIGNSHESVADLLLSSPLDHLLGAARIVVTGLSFSDADLLHRESSMSKNGHFWLYFTSGP